MKRQKVRNIIGQGIIIMQLIALLWIPSSARAQFAGFDSVTVPDSGVDVSADVTDTVCPEPVTTFTATPAVDSVELNWTKSISIDVANQILYQKQGTGSFDGGTNLGTAPSSVEVTGLTPGTAYTFQIVVVDNSGNFCDDSTSEVTTTTDVSPTSSTPTSPYTGGGGGGGSGAPISAPETDNVEECPLAVTDLVGVPTTTTIDLSWTKSVSDNADNQVFYIGKAGEISSGISITPYPGSVFVYSLLPSTTYLLRIQTVTSEGYTCPESIAEIEVTTLDLTELGSVLADPGRPAFKKAVEGNSDALDGDVIPGEGLVPPSSGGKCFGLIEEIDCIALDGVLDVSGPPPEIKACPTPIQAFAAITGTTTADVSWTHSSFEDIGDQVLYLMKDENISNPISLTPYPDWVSFYALDQCTTYGLRIVVEDSEGYSCPQSANELSFTTGGSCSDIVEPVPIPEPGPIEGPDEQPPVEGEPPQIFSPAALSVAAECTSPENFIATFSWSNYGTGWILEVTDNNGISYQKPLGSTSQSTVGPNGLIASSGQQISFTSNTTYGWSIIHAGSVTPGGYFQVDCSADSFLGITDPAVPEGEPAPDNMLITDEILAKLNKFCKEIEDLTGEKVCDSETGEGEGSSESDGGFAGNKGVESGSPDGGKAPKVPAGSGAYSGGSPSGPGSATGTSGGPGGPSGPGDPGGPGSPEGPGGEPIDFCVPIPVESREGRFETVRTVTYRAVPQPNRNECYEVLPGFSFCIIIPVAPKIVQDVTERQIYIPPVPLPPLEEGEYCEELHEAPPLDCVEINGLEFCFPTDPEDVPEECETLFGPGICVINEEDPIPDPEILRPGCPVDFDITIPANQRDFDGDGLPDSLDPDDDNDGTPDLQDDLPYDSSSDTDFDRDCIGDEFDEDLDNDEIPNPEDNCPYIPNPDQEDYDGNGVGNACDPNRVCQAIKKEPDTLFDSGVPLRTVPADERDIRMLILEQVLEKSAEEIDLDIDGLPDYWEEKYFGDITVSNGEQDYDGDRLTDLEEYNYYTDPTRVDTDNDGISDYDEIQLYFTDPKSFDTDGDGISDFLEINVYQTNPLNLDSDSDGFFDGMEVTSGTNPLSSLSKPEDLDGDLVDDAWVRKFFPGDIGTDGLLRRDLGISLGTRDSDEDGLTDMLEYWYGTNPLVRDTDGDGYTDGEEVLDLKTDPKNPRDPADDGDMKFTNWKNGDVSASKVILVRGYSPVANMLVRLYAINSEDKVIPLGETEADDKGKFAILTDPPLNEGSYYLFAYGFDGDGQIIQETDPVQIFIDTLVDLDTPTPERLGDARISKEDLLQNLQIEITERKPAISGTSVIGSKVTATFQSLIFSASLIADTPAADFKIQSPEELELGDHRVMIYAENVRFGIKSDLLVIPFTVEESLIAQAVQSGGIYWLLIVVVIVIGFIVWMKRRKGIPTSVKTKKKKRKTHLPSKGKITLEKGQGKDSDVFHRASNKPKDWRSRQVLSSSKEKNVEQQLPEEESLDENK